LALGAAEQQQKHVQTYLHFKFKRWAILRLRRYSAGWSQKMPKSSYC